MFDIMLEKMEEKASFRSLLWTSDEAHFHLDWKVFWGSEKPTEVAQIPLHSAKCTVWAAISEQEIIRPFFSEEHGTQFTVTKERYVEVLEDFKKEIESLYPSLMTKFWFQKYGASSHTSNISQERRKKNFGKRVQFHDRF